MAGASDPTIAAAIAAQSKSIESQSKTLAAQSKLLQQLCDRLESHDERWRQLESAVGKNVDNIAALTNRIESAGDVNPQADLGRDLWAQLDAQVAELQSVALDQIDSIAANTTTRVAALENVNAVFDAWRPRIENSVDTIKSSVEEVRTELGRVSRFLERAVLDDPSNRAGILGPFASATERAFPAVPNVDGPIGTRSAPTFRETGLGGVSYPYHLPTNGMPNPTPSQYHDDFEPPPGYPHHRHVPPVFGTRNQEAIFSRSLGNLPKLPFPAFDGENPKLWQSRCESYFRMYDVEYTVWVRVASMQLVGAAARWWQSVESHAAHLSWEGFCALIRERFAKNQHQLLLRQLFHIRQSGSVAAYVDEFSQLVDKLNAYQHMSDPMYYTMKFVDGLRDDIKAVVMLQRPNDFDTAAVLAQLQEEAGEMIRRRDSRRMQSNFTPFSGSQSTPIQASTPKDPKTMVAGKQDNSSSDSRLTSLYAYRKAQGLCYKCGLKYNKGHRCADTVQLQMVEELWQMVSLPDQGDSTTSDIEDHTELNSLLLSQAAAEGIQAPRTMRFVGHVAGMDVLALLDSGSSHTFVSNNVASSLSHIVKPIAQMGVQVANGSQLSCSCEIVNASWSIGGVAFTSNLKVLPLTTYDLIVGMDWLEAHSPMMVHWSQKWLAIPLHGNYVTLQGIGSSVLLDSMVQVCNLLELSDKEQSLLQNLPSPIQALIQRFSSVFEVPKGLPPVRECDHQIPLLPGARPVQMRPYRYAPALKNEIEQQVTEMLNTGIIQPSKSAFSSSVILVKKKDHTYRFCVDYRHLNALTLKTKFPVPVIDEFLDELHGASWFTTLDLRAGFHQIRMHPQDQYKTAFQTHHGHFEFRVMAFGLSGAPATFQGAMNSTLAPLLRKCALVFFDDILVYSCTWEDHLIHLSQVFQLLLKDQWHIKLSKCAFAQQQIAYLGHVISSKGVATDPAKIEAVKSWPVPINCKELRSFLGLAGYYRKFVRHFGIIAKPLTNLLKKGVLFVWTHDHMVAFETLKQSLCAAPVLALPNFAIPFAIESDASGSGIGAVLLQEGHPLAFVSKALGPKNQGLSTYEKEYLAILLAVTQWRQYLQHAEFTIFTDHRSLSHLTEQKLHTPWQQRVFSKLLGLQYRIVYKKGIENGAADALSRRPHTEASLFALSSATPQWLIQIADSYQNDASAQKLITQLSVHQSDEGPYTLQSGLIRYKGRVWVGADSSLQSAIISSLHDSPWVVTLGFLSLTGELSNCLLGQT